MEKWILQSSELLYVDESTLNIFKEIDPYNNNEITGTICKQSDHRYGALVIYSVNGVNTIPQIIYATPKLHYPFSSNGDERKYQYPKFVKIKVYEKLDGTNILAYKYHDADGNEYTTFKTRLTPVLKKSQFGDFKSLWDDMLKKYPIISTVPDGVNMSYELYGYRNTHLINYSIGLDTRLLFGVNQPNAGIITADPFVEYPRLECLVEIDSKSDFVQFYNQHRDEAESKNKKMDDGTITGTEGFVFYVLTEVGEWIMYKVKPESVEEVHWATEFIPLGVITATAWNTLEASDGFVSTAGIVELLKEEFDDGKISKSLYRIEKARDKINDVLRFRLSVREIYDSLASPTDKKSLMRKMAEYFSRNEMRKVYSSLLAMNLICENN